MLIYGFLNSAKVGNSVQMVENLPSPRYIKSHLPWQLLPKQLDVVKPKVFKQLFKTAYFQMCFVGFRSYMWLATQRTFACPTTTTAPWFTVWSVHSTHSATCSLPIKRPSAQCGTTCLPSGNAVTIHMSSSSNTKI